MSPVWQPEDGTKVLLWPAAGDRVSPGWQPIETAPKDGTKVLIWARDCGHPDDKYRCMMGEHHANRTGVTINGEQWSGWQSSEGHCDMSYGECDFVYPEVQPTHWMPLPDPPA